MFKRFKQFKIPMFYKIILTFTGLLTALVVILMVSNIYAQKNAVSFLKERTQAKYQAAIDEIESHLEDREVSSVEDLVDPFLDGYMGRHGIRMEIYSMEGELVFSNLKGPEPQSFEDPQRFPPGVDTNIEIDDMPILVEGNQIGYARVRIFDPRLMNQNDFMFFESIARVFTFAMAATLVITLIISFLLARSITKPLKKVSDTAASIQEGNLQARASVSSQTKEIAELGTAVNRMASTLEKQDALRKQVTSDMAHEIRTPLTALKNFFEAFMDGVYEPDTRNLEKCHDEILRMSDLVERLKDLATIEETNLSEERRVLDLSLEATTMSELLQPEFDRKAIDVQCIFQEKVMVHVDQNHLRQIIGNLLTNACRYTDEGGQVVLRTAIEGEEAVFEVEDNGIGISKEDQANVFERFYRADKSRDRATGGMGVGLTIVHTLLKMYEGKVEVTSELGKGTTFTVRIPLWKK